MNVVATELNVAEEITKADEAQEILALEFDDLDLVGGGLAIGGLL